MIKQVTMYSVVCDRCGKTFIDEFNGIVAWLDEGTAKEQAMESEWVEIGDKHYCPFSTRFSVIKETSFTGVSIRFNNFKSNSYSFSNFKFYFLNHKLFLLFKYMNLLYHILRRIMKEDNTEVAMLFRIHLF
jgi:hypothetical protein